MSVFQISAILLTVTALFSYANKRFLRLPMTIGVLLIGLVVSSALAIASHFGYGNVDKFVREVLATVDFDHTLIQGLLSFLLFAGALHLNIGELIEERFAVAVLATVAVVLSTFAVGTLIHFVSRALGLELDYAHCLVFGALISPTDPIAVLGVLKRLQVPRSLEVRIAGESLFNDGMGLVVFLITSGVAASGQHVSAGHVLQLFLREAGGGVAFGFVIGWVAYRLLSSIDDYKVEVLLTLALVSGGYALATLLHVSGPIAIVVAGLIIGNHGRRYAMSQITREHLDMFWELIDEILNAVLFVLIGFEMLSLTLRWTLLWAGLAAVPVVLLARWVSVAIPLKLLNPRHGFGRGELTLLTWGALRGGISVALALSLPASAEREVILAMTYVVVVGSITVQGLTLGPVVRRIFGPLPASVEAA